MQISIKLTEARYRAFYLFFSLALAFLSSTFYCNALTHLICTPFSFNKERTLFIFTHVTEGLYAAVDVSIMSTLFFCMPLLIYQLYSFFVPSCHEKERSTLNIFLFLAAFLFLSSLYLAFTLFLPKICVFLQQFQFSSGCMEIKLEARIGPAVRWCCTTFLFTAIFFQIPLFLSLLLKWQVINCHFLGKKRKQVFFFILLTSSLLSPPDVSTQCSLAVGAFFLYELFLWFALFYHSWQNSTLL